MVAGGLIWASWRRKHKPLPPRDTTPKNPYLTGLLIGGGAAVFVGFFTALGGTFENSPVVMWLGIGLIILGVLATLAYVIVKASTRQPQ